MPTCVVSQVSQVYKMLMCQSAWHSTVVLSDSGSGKVTTSRLLREKMPCITMASHVLRCGVHNYIGQKYMQDGYHSTDPLGHYDDKYTCAYAMRLIPVSSKNALWYMEGIGEYTTLDTYY